MTPEPKLAPSPKAALWTPGVALGIALGAAFDNLALGVAIGMGVALAVGRAKKS